MKKFLLFLTAFLTAYFSAMAAEETITFSEKGWSNQTAVTDVTQNNVKLTFAKSTGSAAPTYYSASPYAVRCYANNTLAVSTVDGSSITAIEFTWGGTTTAGLTPSTGTLSGTKWTGSASSVTFTVGSSGQQHITTVKVTYSGSTNPDPGTGDDDSMSYTITFNDNGSSDLTNEISSNDLLQYITEGKDYVNSASGISKVYKGSTGLKFGTASVVGTITLDLSEAGKVNATKIVVNAQSWGEKTTTTLSVNGNEESVTGTSFVDYEYDVTGNIESIALATSGSEKRCRVKSITVYYEEEIEEPSEVATPVIGEMVKGEYCYTTTITCETEGAKIYYTTNGEEPTAESTEYTAPVELYGKMTVKAIAIKDDKTSKVVSRNFDAPVMLNNFNAFSDLPDGTQVEISANMTGLYQGGSSTMITDGTGYMQVYGYNQPTIKPGDKFNSLTGTYTIFNGQPEIKDAVYGEITEGEAPEVAEFFVDDVTALNLYRPMKLENVTISDVKTDDKTNLITNFSITGKTEEGNGEEGTIAGYNQFKLEDLLAEELKEKALTVYGFVGRFNANIQFWAYQIEEYVAPEDPGEDPEDPAEKGEYTGNMTTQLDMNMGQKEPDLNPADTYEVTASYDNETGKLTIYNFVELNPITFVVDMTEGTATAEADQISSVEEDDDYSATYYYGDITSKGGIMVAKIERIKAGEAEEGEAEGEDTEVEATEVDATEDDATEGDAAEEYKTKLTFEPWGEYMDFDGEPFFINAYYNTVVILDFDITDVEEPGDEPVEPTDPAEITITEAKAINITENTVELEVTYTTANFPEDAKITLNASSKENPQGIDADVTGSPATIALSGFQAGNTYTFTVTLLANNADGMIARASKDVTFTTAQSGISSIDADAEGARYFNLQGVEVAAPAAGQTYIKVVGSKAVKVLVK
ncbi:MAG: chitobiase/beta-hexosaminidase C-terminal domain-containing protein [Muribaculaceae bacterium]|nr:chitobiase/beta-hexosaminidase C-terminal domain-containing protein [Muribaculaceae bacterium]